MTPLDQWIYAAAGCAAMMLVLWAIQRKTGDAGIVDVGWTAGVGLCAIFFAATMPERSWRTWAIGGATAAWSFRLASYILFDRVLGHTEEDGRYKELRRSYGDRAQTFFFWFFLAQAALILVFVVSPWIGLDIHRDDATAWHVFDIVGFAIIATAIVGETLADRQLARFRKNKENKGRVCRAGLWAYSRHPNYFFEWLHWWAYVAFAVGSPLWGWTLVAPTLMLFFLLRVTGIPATEAQSLRSRGDEYRKYQREVSALVPWFPKHE